MYPAPSPLHYSTMRPQAPGAGNAAGAVLDTNAEELRNAEWYFGRITRENALAALAGQPDGSFLVRDALSKEGEYTLTLMKDGSERLIKICHLNGKYGFVDCKFNSVTEMINYYRVNSLMLYNKTLDITLSNPLSRPDDDDEIQLANGDLRFVAEQYLSLHQLLYKGQQSHTQKLKVFKAIENEIHEKKLNQEIFQRADKIFQSQIKLAESYVVPQQPQGGVIGAGGSTAAGSSASNANSNANSAATGGNARQQEQEKLQQNLAMLKNCLGNLHQEMSKLNRYLDEKRNEYLILEREITAANPELQKIAYRKERYAERLMELGIKDDDIKQFVEMGFEAWKQCYESVTNQPHNDESLWFMSECSRQTAEDLLMHAPTGTFLIRARSAGHYALSIVCKGVTNHCIIFKTDTGFGFAAPYNIYHSLKKLVEHYAANSLEEHNDTLTTTLRIPVIYWHQNTDYVRQQIKDDEVEYRETLKLTEQHIQIQQQLIQEHLMHIGSHPLVLAAATASVKANIAVVGVGNGNGAAASNTETVCASSFDSSSNVAP